MNPEPSHGDVLLCGWCGFPITSEQANLKGYHPWCAEQIEDDIAMEDVR